MKKPFCIRLEYAEQEKVKAFAERNGMKPTAAACFLLLHGIKSMEEVASMDERFSRIETLLAKLQKSNYRALVYLTTSTPADQSRIESATKLAENNVKEIFGSKTESEGANHGDF